MAFRFEKFTVWSDSRKFISDTYKLTSEFPSNERFALVDQIRRAATSIALNVAEGSNRRSDKEFVRFLRIASGSIDEVVTGLYIALDLNYLSKENFDILYKDAEVIAKKISALINSCTKKP